MRRTLIVFLAVSAVSLAGTRDRYVPDGTLVSHWKLNEPTGTSGAASILDAFGSHTGTPEAAINSENGVFDGSILFDGLADFITVTDDADFTFFNATDQPFSISAWVNITSQAAGQTIVAKGDDTVDGEYLFHLNTDEKLVLRLIDDNADGSTFQVGDDVLANGWTHVVATYNGSGANTGITLYANGVAIDQTGGTAGGAYVAMEDTAYDLVLGAQSDGGDKFQDKIDDVRIYSEELTGAQIHKIFKGENWRLGRNR
jgi:hypothetical protein